MYRNCFYSVQAVNNRRADQFRPLPSVESDIQKRLSSCSSNSCYRKLYPQNSPHIGIQLLKIGKLQLYLGELTQALKSFHQGQDIFRVSHGEKHEICTELLSLIHQCEEEMRMKLENG